MKKQSDVVEEFEVFPWHEHFDTGIEVLDEQHKNLVKLLNQLARSLAILADPIELNEVFDEMAAYADYHFQTEEAVWQSYFEEDSWCSSHHHAHNSFISEVLRLKEEEKTKPIEEVIEGILNFLTNWLRHHILDADKRMAMTLEAMDSGMSLEQAKEYADSKMNGSKKVLIETVLSMNEVNSSRTLDLMKEKAERKRIDETLNAILESKDDVTSHDA